MKILLTADQLKSVEERLQENIREEEKLQQQRDRGEYVSGWDFVHLDNEQQELIEIRRKGYIETQF